MPWLLKGACVSFIIHISLAIFAGIFGIEHLAYRLVTAYFLFQGWGLLIIYCLMLWRKQRKSKITDDLQLTGEK
jgi:hypothetical protein